MGFEPTHNRTTTYCLNRLTTATKERTEKKGFEPLVGVNPRLISSQVHSTTLPLLLLCKEIPASEDFEVFSRIIPDLCRLMKVFQTVNRFFCLRLFAFRRTFGLGFFKCPQNFVVGYSDLRVFDLMAPNAFLVHPVKFDSLLGLAK